MRVHVTEDGGCFDGQPVSFDLEDIPAEPWRGRKPRVGERLGGYRLLHCLKDGERGLVFRGVHEVTRRRAILKVPVREAVWNGIASASLEAMMLAHLRSQPGVVRVIGASGNDAQLYLVLEDVPGESLDDRLGREFRLPSREAARFLRESAGALGAVHDRGVIHADVKPGNLMLLPTGRVRLIDFGLARFAGAIGGPYGEDVVAGSPLYMSPEQAANRPLVIGSDIYSLGATYYHAFSGRPPFSGESPSVLAKRHLEETPRPLDAAAPDVPPALARIVERMLSKRPEDRQASMEDVVEAVDRWERGDDRHAA